MTAPDAFGMIHFNLNTCFSALPIQLTGYVVDATHIALVETDIDDTQLTGFATGGSAVAQVGTLQPFAGKYVIGISGFDFTGLPSTMASSGLLSVGAANSAVGVTDQVMSSGLVMGDTSAATCVVDPNGTGRVDVITAFDDPNNALLSAPEQILYLTGNGSSALVLSFDSFANAGGSGVALSQATAPFAFTGTYAFSEFSGFQSPDGWAGNDATGVMKIAANGDTTGSLDGYGFSSALFGSNQSVAVDGRFSGTLAAPDAGTGIGNGYNLVGPLSMQYYMADSNNGFFVETDSTNILLGRFLTRSSIAPTSGN